MGRAASDAGSFDRAAAGALLYRFAGPLPDVEPRPDGTRPSPWRSFDGVRMLLAGLVALAVGEQCEGAVVVALHLLPRVLREIIVIG